MSLVNRRLAPTEIVAPGALLVVLAIGIIPLFQRRAGLGLALIALYNVPFLLNNAEHRHLYAYYHTGLMLVSMLALGWSVVHNERRFVAAAESVHAGRRPLSPA